MARPLRILIPGGYYHVTCRGNERKAIFKDDADRSTFLEKLQGSLAIYQVKLHGYVLMSNHFHLMVETAKANLSEFMRHFNISYTSAYNRRHKRVGHLYRSRYKAILIDKDSYLLELSRYIHMNPVRLQPYQGNAVQEQLKQLDKYGWSSLGGYLDAKKKQSWVSYDTVLSQIGASRKKYAEFVYEGMRGGYATPWEKLKGQVVLGEEDFVERVKGRIKSQGSKREQPSIREFEAKPPATVLREVLRYFGLAEKKLSGKRTGYRDERAVAMELMYRYGGVGQAEIGKMLGGLDYTSVSRERKRIRERIEKDDVLRKALGEIETKLLS